MRLVLALLRNEVRIFILTFPHNVGVDNLFNGFNKQVFVIKVDDVPSSIAENDEVSPKRFSCFFQNDLLSEVV